jgi:hypothetical protein
MSRYSDRSHSWGVSRSILSNRVARRTSHARAEVAPAVRQGHEALLGEIEASESGWSGWTVFDEAPC